MDIRRDDIQKAIEAACIVKRKINQAEVASEVLRLGDVTDSSQGIIPYKTEADGKANLHIRRRRDVPMDVSEWKPLLDGSSFVGRYEIRWSMSKPFLNYGSWLWCERSPRYYESPKIVLVRFRNKSLDRKLIGAYDESNFYTRENFNTIIAQDPKFDLKYILALFNSRLLNYWYRKRNDQVSVNPTQFRTLPIFPADAPTQSAIVELVDELLDVHRQLNAWRERGYGIDAGKDSIRVPFEALLAELQKASPDLETHDLFQARKLKQFSMPAECSHAATLSRHLTISPKFPTQITLKFRQLWLDVPDDSRREFLLGLLGQPRLAGQRWSDLEDDPTLRVPARTQDLDAFFAFAAAREAEIRALLAQAHRLDERIDERVLDLYGIADPNWRAKIMDSAPAEEADETTAETPAPDAQSALAEDD